MKTLSSFKQGSERYSSAKHSLSTTPKMHYNGIHNYDSLRLRMTIDGFSNPKNKRLYTASKSVTSKRYSAPGIHISQQGSVYSNQLHNNRYSTLQYYAPQDYTYAFFPSRHKYTKGKKKPVAVKVQQFIEQQAMSKRVQQQLKIREQKKRLQNDQKFQKIKQKYLQLSKSRKSTISDIYKPKTAQIKSSRTKVLKNEGIVISPWENQEQMNGF